MSIKLPRAIACTCFCASAPCRASTCRTISNQSRGTRRTNARSAISSDVPPPTTSKLQLQREKLLTQTTAMEAISSDAPATPPQFVVPTLHNGAPARSPRRDWLRLRGLPYSADVGAVLEFLGEYTLYIAPQGVHMVYNALGRPAGEAFIQMQSEDAASMAAQNRHRHYMMGRTRRYIEVFQSSVDDLTELLANAAPRLASPAAVGASPQPASLVGSPGAASPMSTRGVSAAGFPSVAFWPYPSPPWSPPPVYLPGVTMVLLRGLPYSTTMQDVLNFFRDFPSLTPDCVHIQRDAEGRASGEAVVAFPNREEAERAVRLKNRHYIGRRYIEVFIP